MSEEKNALPPEGPAKPAQNLEKIVSLSPRERMLLPLVFGFCLLTVNTLLETGPTAGLTAAVCAWYALLTVCQGRKLLIAGESRFLLATNLVLAATLALGSNWYFRVWNLLALLALLPIHAVGLSGGQRLPWWRPAMLWERFCLLLWGLFGHLWAAVAALLPEKRDSSARRILPLVLGTAGAVILLAVLVPVLASADALFAAATADLRAFLSLHFSDAVWKAIVAAVMTPFFFGLLYFLRRPTPLKQRGGRASPHGGRPGLCHRAGGGGGAVPAVSGRPVRRALRRCGVPGAEGPVLRGVGPKRLLPDGGCDGRSISPCCWRRSSGPGGRAPPGGRCGSSPPC